MLAIFCKFCCDSCRACWRVIYTLLRNFIVKICIWMIYIESFIINLVYNCTNDDNLISFLSTLDLIAKISQTLSYYNNYFYYSPSAYLLIFLMKYCVYSLISVVWTNFFQRSKIENVKIYLLLESICMLWQCVWIICLHVFKMYNLKISMQNIFWNIFSQMSLFWD